VTGHASSPLRGGFQSDNYKMDDEIDHLKAFEAVARKSESHGYVLLAGLDDARAHQRGQHIAKRPHKRAISAGMRRAIREAPGTANEVAAAFKVSRATVTRFRSEPY
jgi:hypothetical protein